MKYTRYDMKKKKNDGIMVLMVLVVTLILAFVIGTVVSNFLLKNSSIGKSHDEAKQTISPKPASSKTDTKSTNKFIVIQGGKYKNSEYVENEKKLLAGFGNPFVIPESDGTTRVLLGIYNESDAEKMIKTLNEKSAENSKMVLEFTSEDICDKEITEIINANLVILTNLAQKDVKSIQTAELKKWCASLKEVDKGSKNYATLSELKAYINNMPNEIVKEKASDNFVYLYNTLKKIKTK